MCGVARDIHFAGDRHMLKSVRKRALKVNIACGPFAHRIQYYNWQQCFEGGRSSQTVMIQDQFITLKNVK